MELFGFSITRKAAATLSPVGNGWGWGWGSSWLGGIVESFPGAWQRNVVVDSRENLLAFSAVFACVSLISNDISKLRIKLVEQHSDGRWTEVMAESPYKAVLRKPNRYQTRIQFISQWITTKLLHGNAYTLKERDQRGIVVAMYVLDPRLVTVLVGDDGSVWYQLNADQLSGINEPVTVPASEIIHDRMLCLWHPLVGVSPIYACGAAATQGTRIQANSTKFFENMSRPSGILSAPGHISDENATRMKQYWDVNFSGDKAGKIAVLGDGLKYEAMSIPAEAAQLIEQLKWTAEDVARAFGVPLHKIATGAPPTFNNIGSLNQDYYSHTLQTPIEDLEVLLDEGLSLIDVIGPTGARKNYGAEFDLEGLLRMDPLSMADVQERLVRSGIASPNEARLKLNLGPVEGGSTPYLQQQNFGLSALARRDAQADPFAPATPPAAPPAPALPAPAADDDADEQAAKVFMAELLKQMEDLEHA